MGSLRRALMYNEVHYVMKLYPSYSALAGEGRGELGGRMEGRVAHKKPASSSSSSPTLAK